MTTITTTPCSDRGELNLDERTKAFLGALTKAILGDRLVVSEVTDKHGETVMLLQSLQKQDSERMLTIPLAVIHGDEYLLACKSSGVFVQREQADEIAKAMDAGMH